MVRKYAFCGDLREIGTRDYDVVIAGSGAAGLYCALNLDPDLKCAVLNKLGAEESNSMYAQGGIASVTLGGDSWQSHLADTLEAGAGLCDEKAVEILVREGPGDIRTLIELGVPFDRGEKGDLSASTEGAHSHSRILHCGGDATGRHITKTLYENALSRENIEFLEYVTLVDVLTDEEGHVTGAVALNDSGGYILLRSRHVVIASGGIGRIYRNSTNAGSATGDGIAAAMRAGAKTGHMEFVQFHPTALIHPDGNMRFFLISEALRGEGAILRNRRWEPFMQGVHPLSDLAPRDVVSRAIVAEMMKDDLPNVYLDITSKPREFLRRRFPVIYGECMGRGIDIAVDWIPVVPVQHYFMGGIGTDENAMSSVDGLYACGESACTGVHGANRLASNSLLECLVFGRRCADYIGGISFGGAKAAEMLAYNARPPGRLDFETIRSRIRGNMTKKGGIIREAAGMNEAAAEIENFCRELEVIALAGRMEIETLNMASVALAVLVAARARTESVGAHYRGDALDKEMP
ncbi:MAG: L-aspartate oxidase [Clostridiales Family XIII bacterium]|jgi:L-aspartate oxidase|nr:L-aspartate oxidase [Clostridiales Family XIII bacterium]